ncbi:N-alpha-acetyltransferase 35 NatC auxiliary subunit [Dinochytrium kinnereticum]|nr:N-alpha-acetyltransferase 35 NatC auxiliary subunit [Dinochytrium kinnereticum]
MSGWKNNAYEDFKRGANDRTAYKDVTKMLIEATEHLDVGEVIKHPHFTLWDSMSAMEIMDPKMDAGFDQPGRVFKTMPTRAELISLQLSGERMNGLMDKLLEMEMTCIRGNPLTQTLFTCPLLQMPHDIKSKMIRQVVIATLKTVELWRDIVIISRIFEDEEFTFDPVIFGLCQEVADSECINGLLEVEENLLMIWRKLKGKGEQDPPEPLELPEGRETAVLEALLARIRLKRAFLQTMSFIMKRNMPSAKKSIVQAITQLKICRQSVDCSKDALDLFDPDLNRRIHADAPPRAVPSISLEEGFQDFYQMLTDISDIVNLNTSLPLRPLLYFLSHFSSKYPSPNIVSRSILFNSVLQENRLFGKISVGDAIKESVSPIYTLSTFAKNRSLTEVVVNDFVALSLKEIEGLVRLYGFNRSRQRRMMFKLILEFDILQSKIEQLDLNLQKDVGFAGENDSLIEIMGFELDIFSIYEYPSIYRFAPHIASLVDNKSSSYLDHLYDNAVLEVERVRASMPAPESRRVSDTVGKKKKGQKEKAKGAEDPGALPPPTDIVGEQKYYMMAKQLLARGSCQVSFALVQEGLIRKPDPEFHDPEIQFKNRFEVFSYLGSPEIIGYEQMKDILGAMENVSVAELLTLAFLQFEQAKTLLEMVLTSLIQITPNEPRTHVNAETCTFNIGSLTSILRRRKGAVVKIEVINEVSLNEEKGRSWDINRQGKSPLWWIDPCRGFPIFGIH